MTSARPDEVEEWLAGRIEAWIETYKKAMLTPVILRLVAIQQPTTIANLSEQLTATTRWQITERGLYRTVKRLQDAGFLTGEAIDAPRTGAKSKRLTLAPLGSEFLSGIDSHLIQLPQQTDPAG